MNDEIIEEKEFISYKKAIEMLPEKDRIHVIRQGRGAFEVGADRSKENVLELMKQFQDTLELSGNRATSMNHGIALKDDISVLFIETKKEVKTKYGKR